MNVHNEIKELIISSLNLEGISAEDIENESPLFNEGLGLDSIDALELGLAIKGKFNVVLSANSEENRNYFYSVNTLAQFIEANQK